MKFIYLVRNQFSKFWGRELLLILQIVAMICLTAPVMTDVAALLSVNRLAEQITGPAIFMQADSRYLMPDEMAPQAFYEALSRANNIEEVKCVGRTADATGRFDQQSALITFYNPALVENVTLPLRRGAVYFPEESDRIPLLITQELAQTYNIGDEIPIQLYFPVSRIYAQEAFVVVGILDSDGYYYEFVGGGTDIALNAMGAKNSDDKFRAIALSGFDIVPMLDISASCLLFVEDDSQATVDAVNRALAGIGSAARIDTMRQNTIKAVVQDQPLLFVAAALMILLCWLGTVIFNWLNMDDFIGRLSVYYICGMTLHRGFFANATTQLIPILFSVPISILLAQAVPIEISMAGIRMSLLLILPVIFLSILFLSLRFRKTDPILLLQKNE